MPVEEGLLEGCKDLGLAGLDLHGVVEFEGQPVFVFVPEGLFVLSFVSFCPFACLSVSQLEISSLNYVVL